MRFSTLAGAVAMAAPALGREMPKDEARGRDLYDSGIIHEELMGKKMAHWKEEEEAGLMDSSQHPRLNYTKCINGVAEAIPGNPLYTFKCKNIDLYDFLSHDALGAPSADYRGKSGSSSWGWVDEESGREFIATGMYDGVGFIEVLPEGRMLSLGFLPKFAPLSDRAYWTEIRSYKHYMVIGSELEGNGVQIFDMKKLLDIAPEDAPKRFSNDADLTSHFNTSLPLGRAHNVHVNEEAQYGVAVGAAPRTVGCMGGLVFFNLEDPSNPEYLGCDGSDGYVHDVQCLIYRGPDSRYDGKDICYGYNEDTLTIYDVTDKKNSKLVSRTSYEGASYTHQGTVNDINWQEYIFMDDEYDEYDVVGPALDGYPVTYVWDISDLEAPKQTGLFKHNVVGVDHNQYMSIDGQKLIQSCYGAGMRIFDVSSVVSGEDTSGDSVCETAFFDIYPEDDDLPGGGGIAFSGSWSSYGQLPSGYMFINTIERGGYLVKVTKEESCPKKHACNADNCLRAMRANSIEGRLEESQEFCGDFLDGWNADVAAVPTYLKKACPTNVISRVSSACSCLPTAEPTA
ncbi:uncharacterized protein J7T54_007156 [Emericellopsis cladophorae]|uniref:Uncharacterized protein n=1 Tax=Emericellopsis cladophorae TaxID=2686198 RepID=A0A9P9Y9E4_9HYPO|nr:uncharacterized protein J7T54_007156 [Emericellopsis cladophorae]KAI6785513.1 hypothetical protein J7T54_007156 [Emericellopsis cladophorae]